MVLALLTVATCWAVAALASPWLVAPYLLLMALILFSPPGRPRDVSGRAASASADLAESSSSPAPSPDVASALSDPAAVPDPDSAPSPAQTKGRRGGRKSRKTKPEPVEARWVQVGPGKFVRVEGSASAVEAGPHDAVGLPVEAFDTPQPPSADGEGQRCPDPADTPATATEVNDLATGPGHEPSQAREFIPVGFVLPGPPPAINALEEALSGSEDGWDDVPAADGIAPQAEDVFLEVPEADRADSADEEGLDRDRDESIDHDFADDRATNAARFFPDLLGPAGAPSDDRTDEDEGEAATPVPTSDRGSDASVPWLEGPAEKAVAFASLSSGEPWPIAVPERSPLAMADEAAIGFVSPDDVPAPSRDDGGPSDEDADLARIGFVFAPGADLALAEGDYDGPSEADLADDSAGAVPDARLGSFFPRASRLAPRPRTRDGTNRPANRFATPSGLRDRSRRRTRRPLESRPPSRRNLGRPRQITRTTPPRSPPHRGRLGGRMRGAGWMGESVIFVLRTRSSQVPSEGVAQP